MQACDLSRPRPGPVERKDGLAHFSQRSLADFEVQTEPPEVVVAKKDKTLRCSCLLELCAHARTGQAGAESLARSHRLQKDHACLRGGRRARDGLQRAAQQPAAQGVQRCASGWCRCIAEQPVRNLQPPLPCRRCWRRSFSSCPRSLTSPRTPLRMASANATGAVGVDRVPGLARCSL